MVAYRATLDVPENWSGYRSSPGVLVRDHGISRHRVSGVDEVIAALADNAPIIVRPWSALNRKAFRP